MILHCSPSSYVSILSQSPKVFKYQFVYSKVGPSWQSLDVCPGWKELKVGPILFIQHDSNVCEMSCIDHSMVNTHE